MRVFVAVLTVSLVVPLSTLLAQQPPPRQPGMRVRVTQECTESYANRNSGRLVRTCPKHVGMFTAISADSIVLESGENGGRETVPLLSVTSIESSQGQKTRIGRGALIGLAIGVGGGAVVGAAALSSYCFDSSEGCPAAGAAIGAVYLGVPGLLIGTVIGAIAKTDRWEEVPRDRLRVSLAPRLDGKLALGMSVSF